MEFIINFLALNWETIIAILGFVISLINLIYLIKNNVKSIGVREMFFLKILINKKIIYQFSIMLINKSKQPISILNMEIINKGKQYYVKEDKSIITERKTRESQIITADFPINLTCMEAQKEILEFKLDEELENEKFDLIIYTNRGKIIKNVDFTQKQITPEELVTKLF